ncbi:MAG: UDP-glucose/GDP-mannose dehydrogenase family protein [Dehalococcoidia bacterium]|nr:UDP-glucose/GDP-mannose dehydrogenase family protein [Dehalococcoidia bacterium]
MSQLNGKAISVIGLGVVGLTTAVGFRLKGYTVTGIDIDPEKVIKINDGISPIYERALGEALKKTRVKATTDFEQVLKSDISFLCGGTPGSANGAIDLHYVQTPVEQLAQLLKRKGRPHLVVIRSTVVPGTIDEVIAPYFSGLPEVGICANPEFLQMGTALEDFMSPSRIVIGENDRKWGDILVSLYKAFSAPIIRTDFKTAEMIKYASNACLASKISFINEIGNICKKLGIDAYGVAEGMELDGRIGVGHLRAGIGYGGSCFPKDIAALVAKAKEVGYQPNVLQQIVALNNSQPKHMIGLLKKHVPSLKDKVIGILGLTFKPDTDDISESQAIYIVEMLLKEGAKIRAYDPQGMHNFQKLFPNIEYASSAEKVLESDAVLIVTEWDEFGCLDYKGCIVVDGRRVDAARKDARIYEGICW